MDVEKINGPLLKKPLFPDGMKTGAEVIIADPPWQTNQRGAHGAINKYRLMNLEWIKALPVNDLASKNCQLWLWCYNSNLPEALDVMKAWGFRYVSKFTWCKVALPLGVYLRCADEVALLGIKGKAPVRYHSQMSWGIFPRQEHSHKPEEFHILAQRLHEGPYLELFARRKMPGWFCWGDELEDGSDIAIPGCPVPKYSKTLLDSQAAKSFFAANSKKTTQRDADDPDDPKEVK